MKFTEATDKYLSAIQARDAGRPRPSSVHEKVERNLKDHVLPAIGDMEMTAENYSMTQGASIETFRRVHESLKTTGGDIIEVLDAMNRVLGYHFHRDLR